jgi:lipoprotein-releasing system ATP-binding protein
MDEPTGNLDPRAAAQVLDLVDSLQREHCAFVVVTHDATIAAHMQRVLRLEDGLLHEARA